MTPLHHETKLGDKFSEISPISFVGYGYRIVRQEYDPLSTEGSLKYGGRYNVKGKFGALYIGDSQSVCEAEMEQKTSGFRAKFKHKIAKLEISFRRVIDLTNEENCKILNIKKDQLLSEDRTLPQSLSYLAYHMGYEALITPSATGRGENIIVFPDNIKKGSSIKKVSEEIL